MRLKNSLFFNSLLACSLSSFVLWAQDSSSADTPKSKNLPQILINDGPKCSEAKVEEGTAVIKGKPAASESAAKKNWDRACRKWQRHLRRLNANNVMIDDCGEPSSKAVSSTEDSREILFESKAIYKIKLGCP